jgi:hypothetical protein
MARIRTQARWFSLSNRSSALKLKPAEIPPEESSRLQFI